MLKIYGTDQCPDCVNCKEELTNAEIAYEYRNISENLLYLKEFLSLRDREGIFAPVKEAGKIGIPCIQSEDGTVSLSWEPYLK